ncbi:non-specific serine/threonine protein kinase [Starmerella bacillaris]|uniref:non-specific serine/threonine protein kinase n=1 Tax=Starmerella bacillaris TaxID=1247836 RepID=A0AAV5RLS2_STABA|nr:non-specific serine/threonine protein kinase [Starmerella bacillaris]
MNHGANIGEFQQRIQTTIWSNNIIGNYEIKSMIGEGSYSKVFLAEHILTRHRVVLKSADKSQSNLAAEIANMSLLAHPHIVRMYEYIVLPDKVWIVLEYCGGKELFHHLVQNRVIGPARAAKLFSQLASAVAYVHRLNCAHRDLKLENVLLDENGDVKLGDFGFARNYIPRSMLETVCGTESYMAPELILRKKYNPECADVWSLGVILYAMLYGRLPFDEENVTDTVRNIVERDPSFPVIENDENLVSITKLMLHKNPLQRPKAIDLLGMLGEHGKSEKHFLAKQQRETPKLMSSKQERRLLKGMKSLNIDLHELATSVVNHRCDPLHGLWFTALDRSKLRKSKSTNQLYTSTSNSTRAGTPALSSVPAFPSSQQLSSVAPTPKSPKSPRSPKMPKTPKALRPPLPNNSCNASISSEQLNIEKPRPMDRFLSIFNISTRLRKSRMERKMRPQITPDSQPQNNIPPTDAELVVYSRRTLSPSPSVHTPMKLQSIPSQIVSHAIARPISIYSQSSQLSQMSQSSVEPSILLSEVQESPIAPVSRKFAGLAPSVLTKTPPGTPISRSRMRLTLPDSMPSKIDEGNEGEI